MTSISIIVPVYNSERYITKCIDSILGQTFKNFELILINDGSTDGSLSILRTYECVDHRIVVIDKKNEGVSIARNCGLDYATGDFVCFIDSDDWVEDTYLESFFKVPISNKSIVIQNILYDNVCTGVKRKLKIYENRNFLLKDSDKVAQYQIFHDGYPMGKLYSMEIIKKNNLKFDERICIHEDHIFVWEYILNIDCIILRESTLYHYMKYGVPTLTSRVHVAQTYLYIGEKFVELLSRLIKKTGITNSKYLKLVYKDFSFAQLFMSVQRARGDEYQIIYSKVKTYSNIILSNPHPNLIKRFVIWLFLKIPNNIAFMLVSRFKFFKK